MRFKTKKSLAGGEGPNYLADFRDVGGFGTFIGVDHFELHGVALGQTLEPISGDSGIMHKHITGTIFSCNETITLLIVEPLYFSTQGLIPTFLILKPSLNAVPGFPRLDRS